MIWTRNKLNKLSVLAPFLNSILTSSVIITFKKSLFVSTDPKTDETVNSNNGKLLLQSVAFERHLKMYTVDVEPWCHFAVWLTVGINYKVWHYFYRWCGYCILVEVIDHNVLHSSIHLSFHFIILCFYAAIKWCSTYFYWIFEKLFVSKLFKLSNDVWLDELQNEIFASSFG